MQRFISEDRLRFLKNNYSFYSYVDNDPVNFSDPLGLYTLQLGFSGGVTGFGITGSTFAGIVIDDKGNIGVYYGGGGGAGVGFGGSFGASGAVSNAATICGVGGPFANASMAAGEGLGGTLDLFTGPGNGPVGNVTGGGVTLGLVGGASSSIQVTATSVNPVVGRKSYCKQ